MDDETETVMKATARASHAPPPFREDCWSEDATDTLVEAWGDRYLDLNRGNLRQKHWQEVADAVNARHGHVKKAHRTDVQCKNRIDTLKKKYKVEKARVSASDGTLTSKWPFFSRLDALIGSTLPAKKQSPSSSPPLALPLPYRKTPPTLPIASPVPVPVAARSVKQKRPAPAVAVDDSFFRRNYSAVAAAAAADTADSESSRSSTESRRRGGEVDGFRHLAQAITRFGEIYERVEGAKQQQMIELEKQRMQFAKDLEFQRMQLFMDTQVQLEKIKRARRAAADLFSGIIIREICNSLGFYWLPSWGFIGLNDSIPRFYTFHFAFDTFFAFRALDSNLIKGLYCFSFSPFAKCAVLVLTVYEETLKFEMGIIHGILLKYIPCGSRNFAFAVARNCLFATPLLSTWYKCRAKWFELPHGLAIIPKGDRLFAIFDAMRDGVTEPGHRIHDKHKDVV
ncbi:hypothetical protein HHK36_003594 [Tetracentron sinense]|uniref:Myb/SANT-like DNA-binding domain-containing protein n=1 Tax=Tetracentron sinense TaxID=13715 RepID=A0A834ZT72_TETSI|nr:hypothetical protein HHK36_003594 [Tetracentron sinense]